jgi:hypothetical protein
MMSGEDTPGVSEEHTSDWKIAEIIEKYVGEGASTRCGGVVLASLYCTC